MHDEKSSHVSIWIAHLSISTLSLYRDQRFKEYCLLRFSARDEINFDALSNEEYQAFMLDLLTASKAIRFAVKPDHMNYELLGNMDPHLHWHIIPRYKTDPRWGYPIWEGRKTEWEVLADAEYKSLIEQILSQLT